MMRVKTHAYGSPGLSLLELPEPRTVREPHTGSGVEAGLARNDDSWDPGEKVASVCVHEAARTEVGHELDRVDLREIDFFVVTLAHHSDNFFFERVA